MQIVVCHTTRFAIDDPMVEQVVNHGFHSTKVYINVLFGTLTNAAAFCASDCMVNV
jgi:hypothetical protein